MNIEIVRLTIDFGLLILIWLVQIIVYPSFEFYSSMSLSKWHSKYTVRITYIVLPLMLAQLVVGIIHLWQIRNWYTVTTILLILALWIMTFRVFVPLHFSIDNNEYDDDVCQRLVKRNWMRTIVWTLLFVLSLLYIIKN